MAYNEEAMSETVDRSGYVLTKTTRRNEHLGIKRD